MHNFGASERNLVKKTIDIHADGCFRAEPGP